MKRLSLLLALALAVVSRMSANGVPEIPTTQFDLKVYGERQAGMIEVRVFGSGVARPGRYFVSEKASAFEAVKQAGITESRFTILRSYNTADQIAQTRFAFDIGTDAGAQKSMEFILEENDVVFAGQIRG